MEKIIIKTPKNCEFCSKIAVCIIYSEMLEFYKKISKISMSNSDLYLKTFSDLRCYHYVLKMPKVNINMIYNLKFIQKQIVNHILGHENWKYSGGSVEKYIVYVEGNEVIINLKDYINNLEFINE